MVLEKINKSKTVMIASVLKQDPNTYNVQNNVIIEALAIAS